MNTDWAKILLFSLIAFALGFVLSCLTCGPCLGHGGGAGVCGSGASCHAGASCGGGAMAHCGHGGKAMGACCSMSKDHGHPADGHAHGDHPGDAEAHRIAKQLEAAHFIGDTTIAIEGGQVRVVRSEDNTSVHVDMRSEN